jgi:hypothetical protein
MGESDYPTDNAFVEAYLYEKKNWIFFLSFFFQRKNVFLSLDKRVWIERFLCLGKTYSSPWCLVTNTNAEKNRQWVTLAAHHLGVKDLEYI